MLISVVICSLLSKLPEQNEVSRHLRNTEGQVDSNWYPWSSGLINLRYKSQHERKEGLLVKMLLKFQIVVHIAVRYFAFLILCIFLNSFNMLPCFRVLIFYCLFHLKYAEQHYFSYAFYSIICTPWNTQNMTKWGKICNFTSEVKMYWYIDIYHWYRCPNMCVFHSYTKNSPMTDCNITLLQLKYDSAWVHLS